MFTITEPLNTDYTNQVEDGFFSPINTANCEQIRSADYYSNMLINRATYNAGTKRNDRGETFEYNLLNMELVQTEATPQKVVDITLSLNGKNDALRLNELIFLLDLRNEKGQLGFKFKTVNKDGRTMTFVENLPGKRIGVVLDQFKEQGIYVKCKVLGIFLNSKSYREIKGNITECSDLENCIRSIKDERGKQLPKQNPPYDPTRVNINHGASLPPQNNIPPIVPAVAPIQNKVVLPPRNNPTVPITGDTTGISLNDQDIPF